MSPKHVKIVLSGGALVLFVLLFIAPKVVSSKKSENDQSGMRPKVDLNLNVTVQMYLDMSVKSLDPSLKSKAAEFTNASNKTLVYFDSLTQFWDKLKRPDLASYFLEQKANKTKVASDWFTAGNRYYYSVQFTNDETERPLLFQSAIRCFKNGLKLDPTNTDSKIMMASCYVEGTEAPMEGISLLKEVEKKDSNNVKLQLTFAFFSVKSGQVDKAITRFNKVLSLDSTYIEAYLHLADIYEQQNKLDKTIEALKKYASKTNDPTSKVEVEKYIKQLK